MLLAFGIFLLALILRVPGLAHDGLIPDEPLYTLRSETLIDDYGSEVQKSPIFWISPEPWWINLSFFDHPPFTFWASHLFMSLPIDDLMASRLPSALASTFATLLVIGIGSRLYGRRAGIIAGALWASSAYAVGFGRSAMLESITILFILLSVYGFVRRAEHKRWLYVCGLGLGLAILSKYTALMLIPAYAFYFFKERRKDMLGPIFLAFAIILPVVIYNLMLLQTAGHFDLQFSQLFGMDVPHWKDNSPAIQRGGFFQKITEMTDFAHLVTPAMLLAILMSVPLFLKKKATIVTMLLVLFWGTLLFFGAKDRFMLYSLPFLVLAIGAVANKYVPKKASAFIVLVIAYQAIVSANTHLLYPRGKATLIEHVTYPMRSIRWETDVPSIAAEMKVLVDEDVTKDIVLDSNMPIEASLWIGLRHKVSGKAQVYWDKTDGKLARRFVCVLYDQKTRKYSFFTGDPAGDGTCEK